MKTFGRIGWVAVIMIVAALVLASCGNSQKKKVQTGGQVQDSTGIIVQESEVIVEIDSIVPDSITRPVKK